MLRDVFYYGDKPNVHPREQFAENLTDARLKATTRDFWIINEFCDYRNFEWDFDFEFLPDEDVWAEDHNNVWPSQHQKDSGTWLCPKEHSDIIIYRCDVDPVIRKNEKNDNWIELDLINHAKFDFSWHPDPSSPPYIYKWPSKFFPAEFKHVLEYRVPGATQEKYMNTVAELLPEWDRWVIPDNIDKSAFNFDWRPNPLDSPFIYEFGTQWQPNGGPRYVVPEATDTKYINDQKAVAIPCMDNWNVPEGLVIDTSKFDFSWHPNRLVPPYIYQFDTQWALHGGPRYETPGATDLSYIEDIIAYTGPCMKHWEYDPKLVDVSEFDFSWHPYTDEDQPYIYQFGTQWQKTGGPKYTTPGTAKGSPIKYIDTRILKAKRLPAREKFRISAKVNLEEFDFSWHPDDTAPPYNYVFGNQWYSAEEMPTVTYRITGAAESTYINEISAKIGPNMKNWVVPDDVVLDDFDFSWLPHPKAPLYIYQFGTQWQKTGGPKYVVPGATDVNYINIPKATKLPSKENWTVPDNIDTVDFDFSWHPDATNPPYIYVFATQWAFSGGPVYTVPEATEVKYVDIQTATATVNMTNWVVDSTLIDIDSFDWSWHPHVEDQPYIYEFGTQWQPNGGPKYVTPGANISSPTKYIDTRIIKAKRLPEPDNKCWNGLYSVKDFDFSWHPDDTAPPYTYVFGNQWYPAEEMPTIVYTVDGATEQTYVNDLVATINDNVEKWEIPDGVDVSSFDFSWLPHPKAPPYIYQFGTQWQKTGGPRYVVEGATEVNYITIPKAIRLPNRANWTVPVNIDVDGFDFSWHPDDTDPDYIYQFGTQWALSGGPAYTVPGATEVKYIEDQCAKALPDRTNWAYDETEIDVDSFDFSWHPYVDDQPYIYQFGTQWQKTGGPRYVTPDADENNSIKYIDTRILKATKLPNKSKFKSLTSRYGSGVTVEDFDYSWHPDDTAPPYVYIFGNQWHSAEDMPTLAYEAIPGVEQQVFVNEVSAKLAVNMQNWKIPEGIDVSRFDFSWAPHPGADPCVYQFGTASDNTDGPIYITPGSGDEIVYLPRLELAESEVNQKPIVEEIDEEPQDREVGISDMFFVDRGNPESAARFEALKTKFGTRIQKTRYLNSWVDTINRCVNRATSELIWVLNSELDYATFTFDYYPNLWQMKMVHVFGTQWSHWGTTFMVNCETFPEDTKYIKIIEHLSNLNFVKTIRATATACVHDIIVIDHGNTEIVNVVEQIENRSNKKILTTIKYDGSYLNTIRTYAKKLPARKEHYLWICSSVCDYSAFDFTYVCDPFAKDNLHVFPSGTQKFGDTFFIDINKTKEIIDELEKLEEYHKVSFNNAMKSTRLPEPIIITSDDTHVNAVVNVSGFPYVTVITNDNIDIDTPIVEPMNLWAPETKNILITSTGATRIVVPLEAKEYVTKELYDYPYIKKMPKLIKSNPIDIVFLSNGETGAEENWEHLLNTTKGLSNRVVRVDGVNGRTAAYHAAAEASNTPWMFTVFAKLKVSNKFDWNWQPDRMQVPKHYIFHAKNPVNGLIYGHQAMIAYNKKLTLANDGKGLDFTLDDEHEVVPLISGIAQYNTDEFSTWRTAFREVIKLRADKSDVSKERLNSWLNKAEGDFAQYSIKGALDADEYYDEVGGEFDKLKLSYEWAWLKKKFVQI